MTSLFFIMLVLFVITIGYLQFQLATTKSELKKIKEIQTATQNLPKEYFTYQKKYKRFNLKEKIDFKEYEHRITDANDIKYLKSVGNSIKKLVDSLRESDIKKGLDIKYQVVIEGMASKDNYYRNFELSYERALSVYKLWKKNNIVFDPEECEIQIAGSGTDGVREFSGKEEKRNQQILIHIVPKIGEIDNETENSKI